MKLYNIFITLIVCVASILQSCDSALDVPANREVENIITNTSMLTTSSSSINFGKVAPGTTREIILTNTDSKNTIEVQTLTLTKGTAGFTLENLPALPIRVKPGTSFTITVRFSSTSRGMLADTILFNGNQTSTLSVYAESTVTDTPVSTNILSLKLSLLLVDFGLVKTGQSKVATFVLTNPLADSSISISNVRFVDLANGAIQVVNMPSVPIVIPPNSAYVFNAQFTPTVKGNSTSRLELIGANNSTEVTITFTGIGDDGSYLKPYVESRNQNGIKTGTIVFSQKFYNSSAQTILVNNVSYRYSRDNGKTWRTAPDAQCTYVDHLNKNSLQTPVAAGASLTFDVTYSGLGRMIPTGTYIFEASVNYTDVATSTNIDAKGQVQVILP